MGEVYRARDTRLDREVAIKVLPRGVASDADLLNRFETEARAASALNHPGIVTVYDTGRDGETSYIALELVEGQSLRDALSGGPPPLRKAVQIAAQLADALAAAHAKGIVHRDLKPDNVMVTREGQVKVLDFGLAKLAPVAISETDGTVSVNAPATASGVILGTVGYMSPEQASGRRVDFRSDQFSFGTILYEVLAGSRAFQRGTAAETLAAIIREEPEPLATRNAKVPGPLRWIVERCLAKEPEERYASTRDLARDLAGLLEHLSETTSAAAGIAAPARRTSRRALAVAAAVLAAAALGLLAGRRLARVAPPSFRRLTFRRGTIGAARFAPDGQTVLYSAAWGAPSEIYSARTDGTESRALGLAGVDTLFSVSSSAELAVRMRGAEGRAVLAQVPLTGGAPRERLERVTHAAWAPDGASMAVVVRAQGRTRIEYPIGKPLLETPDFFHDLKVSPDGKRLALLSRKGTTSGFTVDVVDARGTRTALTSEWPFVEAGGIAWAPSGAEVWFGGDHDGGTSELHAVSLDGRERLLARLPADLVLHDVSRGGRALVAREIRRFSVSVLAPGEKVERDVSWLDYSGLGGLSRDGRRIAIVEFGPGGGKSYTTFLRKTDGSPAVRMTDGGAVLSPDEKWLLSLVRSTPSRRVLVPVGPGSPRTLEDPFATVDWTEWFPDSRRIAITAREAGHGTRIYVRDIEGGAPRAITAEGYYLAWGSQPVSPDGTTLVALDPEGRTVLVPVAGGEFRPVPGMNRGEKPIQWTADGRSLFVTLAGSVPARVFKLDVATGRRELWKELAPPDAAGVESILGIRITPDETSYAYNDHRTLSDLYVVDGLR